MCERVCVRARARARGIGVHYSAIVRTGGEELSGAGLFSEFDRERPRRASKPDGTGGRGWENTGTVLRRVGLCWNWRAPTERPPTFPVLNFINFGHPG